MSDLQRDASSIINKYKLGEISYTATRGKLGELLTKASHNTNNPDNFMKLVNIGAPITYDNGNALIRTIKT